MICGDRIFKEVSENEIRVDPNAILPVSLLEKKVRHRHTHRGRLCEDTERIQPFMSQGERPQKKIALSTF